MPPSPSFCRSWYLPPRVASPCRLTVDAAPGEVKLWIARVAAVALAGEGGSDHSVVSEFGSNGVLHLTHRAASSGLTVEQTEQTTRFSANDGCSRAHRIQVRKPKISSNLNLRL